MTTHGVTLVRGRKRQEQLKTLLVTAHSVQIYFLTWFVIVPFNIFSQNKFFASLNKLKNIIIIKISFPVRNISQLSKKFLDLI